eukprot:3784241-Pyramimonas_sp.AAC.1
MICGWCPAGGPYTTIGLPWKNGEAPAPPAICGICIWAGGADWWREYGLADDWWRGYGLADDWWREYGLRGSRAP